MKSRRQAREVALQALYQCDTLQDWTDENVQLFLNVFKPDLLAEQEGVAKDNFDFMMSLLSGIRENLRELDKKVSSASIHWSVSRMARVDRNILRIAAYEILYVSDIPKNVSINEGIEIAKRFASDDSPTFVNGVLDRVAKLAGEQEEADTKKQAVG